MIHTISDLGCPNSRSVCSKVFIVSIYEIVTCYNYCILGIVIFPEGTRSRNPTKLLESQEFAKKNNLPVLKRVLYPRTKGFSMIAKYFYDNPGSVDYVYDYTFGYYPAGVGIERFAQGPIPVGILKYIPTKTIQLYISLDNRHISIFSCEGIAFLILARLKQTSLTGV